MMQSSTRLTELAAAFDRLDPGRRTPHGIAATLLPFTRDGSLDLAAFATHVARTHACGLDVAVNMDTGFGDLLSAREREMVLDATREAVGADRPFYAAAIAEPAATDPVPSYHAAIAEITARGAIPVIVQCRALHELDPVETAAAYGRIVSRCDEAIAFELGSMFAAHGEIWDDETYARILDIGTIVGAKHSSLDRSIELRRLAERDRRRPGFRVYTGNDLAIDMVAYGSDYLLGLSTFAPESFAARDRAFVAGSLAFLSWNDALQHLGNVAFRAPVPAYKHSAAMYLHLTGGLADDAVHPHAPLRDDPAADRALLTDCARRLDQLANHPTEMTPVERPGARAVVTTPD
jgi:dihydrodipicolinate synthase/N-acetylneuraminate lyase